VPWPCDQRYQWIDAWTQSIGPAEMREFVRDAWRMVVPKRVAAAYSGPPCR
jgi:hypothetical protein